jgi:hypothetical protein
MELRGSSGDTFELRLIGYQLLRGADGLHDRNRLRVHIRASVAGRVWQCIEACLLTWEVESLAEWAESLASGAPGEPTLSFLEPNLWVEFQTRTEDAVQFRVYFEAASRPPWAPADGMMREVWTALECSPAQMREWAADLRGQLARYPQRRLAD